MSDLDKFRKFFFMLREYILTTGYTVENLLDHGNTLLIKYIKGGMCL